jgi:hypothetical protein
LKISKRSGCWERAKEEVTDVEEVGGGGRGSKRVVTNQYIVKAGSDVAVATYICL